MWPIFAVGVPGGAFFSQTSKRNEVVVAKYLSKIGLGSKIYLTIGICLAALCAVALFSYAQINAIGAELSAVAEEDIPFTAKLGRATTSQLEQTIQPVSRKSKSYSGRRRRRERKSL